MGPLTLAVLLACHAQPEPAIEAIRRGDLEAAREVLARVDPDGPAAPLKALSDQLVALEQAREAIHDVEGRMLRNAVETALSEGEVERAARVLGTALLDAPGDPRLVALLPEVERAAAGLPAVQRAEIHGLLAMGAVSDPAREEALTTKARRALVEARHTDQAADETIALYRGVGLGVATHLLGVLDQEYYEAPDWSGICALGGQQLGWLRATQRWAGGGFDGGSCASRADAVAQVEAAVAGLGDVPEEVVVAESIDGALASLDPWTRAVWPAEIAGWKAEHAGVTEGVGLELNIDDGVVVVDRPLPGSPSWGSGIHQGDPVLRISDERFDLVMAELLPEMRLAVAKEALLGPAGTQVEIEVVGAVHTLTRAPVEVETVVGFERAADNSWRPWLDQDAGIAYVKVLFFRPTSEARFDALLAPHLDHVRALVLDLRGNPGGDIDSAVQIADRFVDEGWLVKVSGRVLPETGPNVDEATGRPLAEWNQAVKGHALEGVPVVVLVDADTASAAEVLAGSVQVLAGATVIGAPTWGKGRAQALRADEGLGYAIQFTNLVWTLPDGRLLVRNGGIQPDLVMVQTAGERFQIGRMESARSALRVHADGVPLRWKDPGRREDLPALDQDPVLVAAELVARAWLWDEERSRRGP